MNRVKHTLSIKLILKNMKIHVTIIILLLNTGLLAQASLITHGIVTAGGSKNELIHLDYSLGQTVIAPIIEEDIKGNIGILQIIPLTNVAVEDHDSLAKVYPNPTNHELYIDLPMEQNAHYKLFDMNGKLVYNTINHSYHTSLPMENLRPGLYILKILIDRNQFTFQINKI